MNPIPINNICFHLYVSSGRKPAKSKECVNIIWLIVCVTYMRHVPIHNGKTENGGSISRKSQKKDKHYKDYRKKLLKGQRNNIKTPYIVYHICTRVSQEKKAISSL